MDVEKTVLTGLAMVAAVILTVTGHVDGPVTISFIGGLLIPSPLQGLRRGDSRGD